MPLEVRPVVPDFLPDVLCELAELWGTRNDDTVLPTSQKPQHDRCSDEGLAGSGSALHSHILPGGKAFKHLGQRVRRTVPLVTVVSIVKTPADCVLWDTQLIDAPSDRVILVFCVWLSHATLPEGLVFLEDGTLPQPVRL